MERYCTKLSELPGIEYHGGVDIDSERLPNTDCEPVVRALSLGNGEIEQRVEWHYADGSRDTMRSPARRHVFNDPFSDASELTADQITTQIKEVLELPGTLSDYHFAIQKAHGALYGKRRQNLGVLEDCAWLCWLDIRLVESYPEIILAANGEGTYRVTAFERMISLYETEGYLDEAIEVAERGIACNQDLSSRLEKLRERANNLKSEDEI